MTRAHRMTGLGALAALGALGALGAAGANAATTAADMQAVGHGRPVDVAFGADRMTLSVRTDGSRHLSFSRLSPNVEVMGVSPAVDRTTARTEDWARAWKGLYGLTEPNVVVTSGKGWNRTRQSYTLAKARFNAAKGTMDFTLRPMFTGARGRPRLSASGTRRVKATRRQLGPGTVFVQQATRTRNRGGVDVTHSAGRITLSTSKSGVRHLVLGGYAPTAEVTGVAPAHDRVSLPTAVWVRAWQRLYRNATPNAVLSYGAKGAAGTRVSVSLGTPRFNPVKRTIDFVIHPVGDAALPAVPPGASRNMGSGLLFVDQSTNFGSQTQVQNQAAVNAYIQAGVLDAVSNNVYECCAVATTYPQNVNDVQNGLPQGDAYNGLVTAPGFSGTIEFSGAPAFGSVGFTSNQTITFGNGMDMDGATFGLTGPGAFSTGGGVLNFGEIPPGSPPGTAGTNGLVIYNGDYSNSALQGALGGDSALIGGNMSGATIDALQVNSALLANISFDGATFASSEGGASFNDSALLGVSFEGANVQDALVFYGTDLMPLAVESPTGGSETAITSFAGLKEATFIFAPSQSPDYAAGSSTISEVSFAGSSWDQFAIGNAVIQGSDFSNAALGFPVFTNTSIDNASDFTGTNLGRAQFTSCSLNGTDLTNVTWNTPVFQGTADAPTVLEGVAFSADTLTNNSTKTLRATFTNVEFNGTTFIGLNSANSGDVAFISGIMNSEGVTTRGLGLIAFNTQYVQGQDAAGNATWYQVNSTGTEWTPIDSTTLQESGPSTNVDPVPAPDPAPDPAPGPDPAP